MRQGVQMKRVSIAVAAVLTVAGVVAAQNWDAVQITAEPVHGNVYMLTGQGGNIGVSVGPDGILIVDDQFAPLAEKIRAALGELAGDSGGRGLQFILNTHYHGDHTGGNVEFGPEAPIVAHTRVRERLATEQHIRGEVVPPSPPAALPVITFDDSLSIHFNGEEIEVVHLPHGHTDGDSMVYFRGSNVLHMGDDFFNGRFPFVDLQAGGDVLGLRDNVAAVVEKMPDDVRIIPGHGAVGSKADLQRFVEMLDDCIATVRQGVEAGHSLAEIQAAGLPEEYDDWASGFINEATFAGFIYHSLFRR